ncbi:MAG TPA: GNAT family N-acetyltransferase [Terriglobales bacterium]|nr:GNAT family N-acetyltransferase [Terriglobales bacterium]
MPEVQLRTERLLLRPIQESDIPVLVPLLGAWEVVENTLRVPYPYTEADARAFLDKVRSNPVGCHFGIYEAASLKLCGGIGLTVDPDHRRAELGYWIGHPYWGKGYATEAARTVVRYGFEELKINRIFAGVFSGNKASENVLRKLGFQHEGCHREVYHRWGKFLDSEEYALLAREWRGDAH